MMLAAIISVSVLSLLSGVVTAVAYANKRYYIAPTAKFLASLCFMLIALMSIFRSGNFNRYGVYILCALGCGIMGDIMLAVKEFFHDNETQSQYFLVLGVVFFGLGQIIYSSRMIALAGTFRYWLLPLLFLIPAGMYLATRLKWMKIGRMAPLMAIYSMLLTLTFLSSLNLILDGNTRISRILLTASVFFLVSDTALCMQYYGEERFKRAMNYFIMIFYYVAQIMFAVSINYYVA